VRPNWSLPICHVTESLILPLTGLKPAQQKVSWQKAVKAAPDGKVTAAIAAKVVREIPVWGGTYF